MLLLSVRLGTVILARDPLLNFINWVGVGVFVVNIWLIGAILYQRYRNLQTQKRDKISKNRWMPILVSSLAELPDNLPQIKPYERLLVLEFWQQVERVIRGESRDRLHELAYLLQIPQIARRFLESRQIDRQLIGISVLGSLKEQSSLAKLQAMVKKKNSYLSAAAAIALVKINIEQCSELVSCSICDRLDWSLALVVELFSIEGNDLLISRSIDKIWQLSDAKLYRVFRALEVSQKHQLLPLIPELLHHFSDREEIIAVCLRILSSYKNAEHLDIIREYIEHPSSSIRVQVANGLSQMGTVEDESRLVSLLADPVWWVRYRAAQALVRLPSMNLTRLEQIKQSESDTFARDILTQVIAECSYLSSLYTPGG